MVPRISNTADVGENIQKLNDGPGLRMEICPDPSAFRLTVPYAEPEIVVFPNESNTPDTLPVLLTSKRPRALNEPPVTPMPLTTNPLGPNAPMPVCRNADPATRGRAAVSVSRNSTTPPLPNFFHQPVTL